jgi:hypothetical protein
MHTYIHTYIHTYTHAQSAAESRRFAATEDSSESGCSFCPIQMARLSYTAERRTTSFLDVVSVEDQLVHAYCEQVAHACVARV